MSILSSRIISLVGGLNYMMIRFIEEPRNFIRGCSLLQTNNSRQIEPPQILQIGGSNECSDSEASSDQEVK